MSASTLRTRIVLALLGVAFGLVATPGHAQSRTGFAVSRYEPSERGSDWFVVDALDLRGRSRPSVGVTLDYAYKPLVVHDADQNERLALVRHQLFTHFGGAVVLAERLRLGVNLPVAVLQDGEATFVGGEALSAATAPAIGDLRLAADLRIVGRYRAPIALAVGIRGWLPTGLRSQFTSDGSVRVSPQLLASGELGIFAWAARAAVVYRGRDDAYAGTPLGSEVAIAAGAGLRVGRFLFGPEVFSATRLDSDAFLGRDGTPADAALGIHYDHPSGLRIAAAIGSGLTRGYGSPTMRALASVEWGAPIPLAPADRDKDGISDVSDACPDWPGVPSGDPEQNGCPLPERLPDEDTDGDGIWDRDDACPTAKGVATPDPMTNGCAAGAPRQLALVTKTEILIAEQVRFATDSAELLGASDVILEAVKRLLDEHPEIRKVRVEGHTDDLGDSAYNDDLSARRADSVAVWLREHGIDAARLETAGFGSRRPIESNTTEEGRARNRRVVFTIVERGAPKP